MLRRITRILRVVALSLVSALLLLFAVNNRAGVNVSLFPFPYEAEMPLFLIVILFFLSGVLMGGAALSLRHLRMRKVIIQLRQRNQALENELELLRPAPLPVIVTPAKPAA